MTDFSQTGLADTHRRSSAAHDLRAAAAVRETYRPTDLLIGWLDRHPTASENDQQQALNVAIELKDLGVAGSDSAGNEALRLPDEIRRSILNEIGVEGSLAALSNVPQEHKTAAEQALAELLTSTPIDVDRDNRLQLSALLLAAGWAESSGVRVNLDINEVARDLQRIEFLSSLGGSDLHRFVGRTGVRRNLLEAWRNTKGLRRFYLEGPGGIGKSLTVARFIADLLESSRPADRPDAVFHLDFDRLSLHAAREVTIIQELIQQSAQWCFSEQRDELLEMSEYISSPSTEIESASLTSRSSESSDLSWLSETLRRFWHNAGRSQRIIVFVDSFEQVESIDYAAAVSPERVLQRFAANGVDVLIIYASRSFELLNADYDSPILRLSQLSVREADTYLRNEAARIGLEPTNAVLNRVRTSVGRSPLALRLAVNLLERDGGEFIPDHWTGLLSSPEIAQAMLYDRILRRIRDPQLRKIASPGLLVRRLNAEVIEEVLARPCGIDLAQTDGKTLMAAARSEGQLFVRDGSDPEALWHRQDVRSTMLANIERETDPELIWDINDGAVRYYEGIDTGDASSRTEELYHRLRLDQDEIMLDTRWTEEAGRPLRQSMHEFPLRAKAYLRRKLGAAAKEASARSHMDINDGAYALAETANLNEDVREFRLLARKELQTANSVAFILDRWREDGGRLDVELGDIYATALMNDGRHDEMLALASDVMVAPAGRLPAEARSGVLSAAAALLEGRGALQDALPYWVQSRHWSGASDVSLTLTTLIGCIRIRRKLKSSPKLRNRDIKLALETLKQNLKYVYGREVLAREAAAELGEVLYTDYWGDTSDVKGLVSFVSESRTAIPSALRDPARSKQIAKSVFGPSHATTSLSEIYGALQRLTHGGTDGIRIVVNLLREEVDLTLRRVAKNASPKNFDTGG